MQPSVLIVVVLLLLLLLLAPNAPALRFDVATDFRRSKSPGECSVRKRDPRRKSSRDRLVLAHVTLTTRVARIRSRVGRLEREHGELSRTVAAVQGWAEQQLRAVRSEFTVARVNDSATRVLELRAQKRVDSAAPLAAAESEEEELEENRDTIATPATVLSVPKPSDEDGEETTFFTPDPPLYASRSALMRPPAPLAYPDLIGSEDAAEEAAHPHLGPDETTPPRHGRAAMLVAAYPASEEGGAA